MADPFETLFGEEAPAPAAPVAVADPPAQSAPALSAPAQPDPFSVLFGGEPAPTYPSSPSPAPAADPFTVLFGASPTSRTGSAAGPIPTPAAEPYIPMVREVAARYGLDPAMLAGLVEQESGWQPAIGSSAGAMGLTQLMPATAASLGVKNITDPYENLDAGARYLRQQYDRYGDWTKALAAYNAGPGAVDQYGGVPPYAETQRYVQKVPAAAEKWRAYFAGEAPPPVTAGVTAGALVARAELPKIDTSGFTAATKDIPLLGGILGAGGEVLGQMGRGIEAAIPKAGEAVAEGINIATRNLPASFQQVFAPPPTPAGQEEKAGGFAALPQLAADVAGTLFAPVKVAVPFLEMGASVFGRPVAGELSGVALLAQAGIERLMGNTAKADALAAAGFRFMADPTQGAKEMQAAWNASGAGDIPVIGGFIDDWALSGELFNPLNLIGFGLPGKAAVAARGVPVLRETLKLASVADNAVAKGLGLPITVPLRAAGIVAPRIPVAGKLFQLTKEAKMADEGTKIANTVRQWFSRGGNEAELARLSRGEQVGTLNLFTRPEQAAIRQYADAYGQAVARTGGQVTRTTETEFTEILMKDLAKKYGVNIETKGFSRAMEFAQATVKEGWLGLNPAYHFQNFISNTTAMLAFATAPMGQSRFRQVMARRGLRSELDSEGFTTAMLGGKDSKGGLFRSLPIVGDLINQSRQFGGKIENTARQGAIATKSEEVIRQGMDRVVRETLRVAGNRLSTAEKRAVEKIIRSHQGDAAELVGKLKGQRNFWAHMKDFGDAEGVWQSTLGKMRGKLDDLGDPTAPDFATKAGQIVDDTIKEVETLAQRYQQKTPLNSLQVLRLERPAHAQSFAALKDVDNPERAIDMLAALHGSTALIAEAKAAARAAHHANPAERRRIWQEAHERSMDLINARNEALDLARVHAYGKYTAAEAQQTQAILAALVKDMTDELGAVRKATDAYHAAVRGGGTPATSLEQIWETHHDSLISHIQNATTLLSAVAKGDAAKRMRGPEFWQTFVKNAAAEEGAARTANRGNIAALADGLIADLKGYKAQLGALPAEARVLREEGLGLLNSPEIQRLIAQTAGREYGALTAKGWNEGTKFADKVLFNYGATTNLDKLLQAVSPFTIWQTRNIPLYAQILSQRPGLMRLIQEYEEVSKDERDEDSLPGRFSGFLRSSFLDPIYSLFIGRPIQMFSNPLAAAIGGYSQFDQLPYIDRDMPALGQAIRAAQFLGGGLAIYPYLEIPLNLSGQMGRNVSYGDLFAPSRAARYFGVDVEQHWKRFLLEAQGIESETGNPFLDAQIQRRIAEIMAERNITDEAMIMRAMLNPTDPIHIQARKEAETESNAVSLLRYVFPIGVKTLSPGLDEINKANAAYKAIKAAGGDKAALQALFDQHPELSAYFRRNDSRDALLINAGMAEYYALGTPAQQANYKRWQEADKNGGRPAQERWEQAHPTEMKDVRAIQKLRREFRANPANARATAYMDSMFAASAEGKTLSVKDYLEARNLPVQRKDVDTRDPIQKIARALEDSRGAAEVKDQQAYNALSNKLDAYYALEDRVGRKWDDYERITDSRERSRYLRENPDVAAVVDEKRRMRERDPEIVRYFDFNAKEKAAGRPGGIAAYLGQR